MNLIEIEAKPLLVTNVNVSRIINKGYRYDTEKHIFICNNNPRKTIKIDDRHQVFKYIVKSKNGITLHCSTITEIV